MSFPTLSSSTISVAVAAIGLSMAAFATFRTRRRKEDVRLVSKRSFSLTSVGMAIGGFPERTQVPEHVIHGTAYFKKLPSVEALVDSVVKPFLEYDRLRYIPAPEANGLRESSHGVKLDPRLLVRTVMVEGKDDKVVSEAIEAVLHEPLAVGRDDLPWWEIYRIDNRGSGPSACVLRLHHCLADGISLVGLMEKICLLEDGSPMPSMLGAAADKYRSQPRPKYSWTSILREVIHTLTLGMTRFDDTTPFTVGDSMPLVHNRRRACVVFPIVPLDFIKALKNASGVTVNDILMTAVSQAIRDYCLERDPDSFKSKRPVQCRAMLPVSLPRSSKERQDPQTALRNKFCFLSINMALDADDCLERLNRIHAATVEMKESPRAGVSLAIQNTLPGYLPFWAARQTVLDIFSRHSLVFSNVPGPAETIQVAGQVVSGVQMFYSQLLPQVGILTYGGQVYGNFVLDPELLPNSHRLADFYGQALVQLAKQLKVTVPVGLAQ